MDPRNPPPPCPCCCGPSPTPSETLALLDIQVEAAALRDTLATHQLSISQLTSDLEEERSASATSANEAMSMILRLQREKAEAQLELRQFKSYADEKMAHDQAEIAALEDLIFKRDQAIEALSHQVQAYRHRLLSIGMDGDLFINSEPLTPDSAAGSYALDPFGSRSFRSRMQWDDYAVDLDKYPFGDTPRAQLEQLEQRINQLERMPSGGRFMDKGIVAMANSPRGQRNLKRLSFDSCSSGLEIYRGDEFRLSVERGGSDWGGKEYVHDKVCTVDAVQGAVEGYVTTPKEIVFRGFGSGDGDEESEVKKLHRRLQALEADRESMRQTIISMGTEITQAALLREIALQLSKEAPAQKQIVQRSGFTNWFAFFSVIKCVFSLVIWKKKPSKIKYSFEISGNNVGLLLLLERSSQYRRLKLITRTSSQS